MGHDKHPQPQDTEPKQSGGSNDPNAKPEPPPDEQPTGGLTDPAISVHQVKPAPPGSVPVGAEGSVTLRYITLPGEKAQIYGQLDGLGGVSVDLSVLPCLTVS
jgi:hypothetical protein